MFKFKKPFSMMSFYPSRLLSVQSRGGIDWNKQEKIIMEPLEYMRKLRSKHYALLIPVFNHWMQVPKNKVKDIEEVMQNIEMWSLISDDLQDSSAFRYGVPSTHTVFGVGLTINAISQALLAGGNKVTKLGHPLACKIYLDRVKDYLLGQGIDIYWRDNNLWPTEEEHFDMLKKMVGSFAILPVELLQLFSKDERDYIKLASNIGIYYTIVDNYYNLFQPKGLERLPAVKQDNYTACSDITESKPSLPFIHAMQFPDVASELADILKQRTSDPKLQGRVLELLKKRGSDEYMRDVLNRLEADIRNEIDHLGGNAQLLAAMEDLRY